MQNFFKSTNSKILIAIILLAVFFRLYGINWDQGYHMHPDERMITMVAEKIRLPSKLTLTTLLSPNSPLNPKFFAYGSFPIYLLKFSGRLFSFFNKEFAVYSSINLIGRGISAFADTLAILIIYLIGRRVWTRKVGLLAALFYTLSVFPIQAAHFYAVDTLLNLFILLTLHRLLIFYDKPSLKNAVLSGVFFGLSLATKISATVLITAIGTALTIDLILIFIKRVRQVRIVPKIHREFIDLIGWILSSFRSPKRQKLITILRSVVIFGLVIVVVAGLTFIIFEPYALIDFETFWKQTLEQHQMTKSAYTFPYTLQYVGTTPYLYHLKNLVLWGMGIPLGILSFVATFWLLIRLAREVPRPGKENQEAKTLILTLFFIVYFLVVGRFAIKFMRYALPLYGMLCLFSGYFINNLSKQGKNVSKTGNKIFIVVVFSSLAWSLSFIKIYSRPQTRISATEWFITNVPSGSKIAVEHWDDRVPMLGNYQFLEMPMYDPDSSTLKWSKVNENLARADYIVLASNRLYAPLQKLSDCQKYLKCYPLTSQYYKDLFNGKLGFEKVAEFTSYPTIPFINVQIKDDGADESFTVYDHPKVIIYEKID